jgi:hemolysin activation/secretion protein
MLQHQVPACAVLALLVMAGSIPCHAQVPGRTTQDPVLSTKPQPRLELHPLARPSPEFRVSGQVKVAAFRVTGLTALDPAELEPVLQPWIGKELGPEDFDRLLDEISKALRDRGLLVATAYLPAQSPDGGTVEIAVLEGRVAGYRLDMEPGARLKRRTAEGFLSRLGQDVPIRKGVFDTPLLLLNDLPGVRVDPILSPGRSPGTADLQVRASDAPLAAGFVSIDNHEIEEVGRYAGTFHLRLRNPAGIGDLATGEFRATHTGDLARGTLSYSVPVNHAGTRVAAIASAQSYRLEGALEALQINGNYTRGILAVTHPFLRMHDSNVYGDVSLNRIDVRDHIDLFDTITRTRHSYVTTRLNADRVDRWLGLGRTNMYVEYQAGQIDVETPFDPLRIDGHFGRWRARVERQQSVSPDAQLSISLFVQGASKNLAAGREFELGGPNGVRAYPVGEMYPDEGYLGQVEYHHRLYSSNGWALAGGLFWDTARGRLNKDPLPGSINNSRTFSGVGTRLVIGRPGVFDAGVTLAWRTTGAAETDRDLQPRVWFTAAGYF